MGSSYFPSELIAAFLWAQMEEADAITRRRLAIWDAYHLGLADLEAKGYIRRPFIPEECAHNAHMYYIILPDLASRSKLIEVLKSKNIHAVFHYIPLHSAPAGLKHGATRMKLEVTDSMSERLLRLPIWLGIEDKQLQVIEAVSASF